MSVAVVIPLYNHERYIEAALHSILEQTMRVERIVIVDDGSTDGSSAFVENFRDDRITLLRQQNSGKCVATMRGIREAQDCDYVAVLNSDDAFHPERLYRIVTFLKENPQHEIVCTRFRMIDEMGVELPPEHPKVGWARRMWEARRDEVTAWLGIGNFTKTTSNLVGRTSYFLEHPLRDYRYVSDYEFALRCAFERKLGVLDQELLFYRTHGTNAIKSGGSERVVRETLQMNFDLLRDLGPRFTSSPKLRLDYANYFRELIHNHADFRAEPFFALLSGMVPDAMSIPEFPELAGPPSRRLKLELAELAKKEALQNRLGRSKWLKLGRKLGFIPHDFP